jgi:RNA methyltransferase, TrmH family
MTTSQSFKHIISRDNPIFKQLKKLADNARERRAEGKTLLDGVHLIEGYLQAFKETDRAEPELVIIPEGKSSLEATNLMQTLQDVNTIMLPTLMFAELTPVASSTGILTIVKTPQITLPETIEFALMLEDIQDPGNLGSILRTALGAGVQAVYLSKGCTDAWSPKALRGGQGAQFHLPMIEGADLLEVMQIFSQNFAGKTYATTMNGESIYAQNFTTPSAFIIGNEGAGLSQKIINAASQQISIPIHKNLESLNAGVATAVCLFERARQMILLKG